VSATIADDGGENGFRASSADINVLSSASASGLSQLLLTEASSSMVSLAESKLSMHAYKNNDLYKTIYSH